MKTATIIKDAWLIDKPILYILKGSQVEVLDELDEAYVIRHNAVTSLIKKEDAVINE